MRETLRERGLAYALRHGTRSAFGSVAIVAAGFGVVAAVVAIFLLTGGPLAAEDLEAESEGTHKQVVESYEELPLTFVENQGQTDERVRYHAQGAGYAFYFTPEEVVLSLVEGAEAPEPSKASDASPPSEGVALALRFVGANPDVVVEGEDRAPGETNYLRGNDPDDWQTELAGYTSVVYRELWPGIDMVLRGHDGQLKYEFRVRPGAQPSDIRLAYAGADGLRLDDSGGLLIETPMGELEDAPPVSYQEIDGERVPVGSRYVLSEDGEPGYGFAVGTYQQDHELVIDPGVDYSTFLGGSSNDSGSDIAVDGSGNAYIVGSTQSTDFPTTTGAFDRSFNGGFHDVFVSKLNADGSGLVYSTYLGGSPTALPAGGTDNVEHGRAIAVDSDGNAYVAGQTSSSNFPTTPGAFDRTLAVGTNTAHDGFVTKLNPQGSGLVYSTFLGGTSQEDITGIALDRQGNAYLAGDAGNGLARADGEAFPTTAGAFDTTHGANGNLDSFAAKLNAQGSQLVYSTFLGGSENERPGEVRVDADGNAYHVGSTRSADFPTTEGAFDTTRDGTDFAKLFDAYVTKLNPQGTGLVYSTFLGGSDVDFGGSLAIDAAGNAYVVGGTLSPEFPTTAGAFDTTPGPRSDGLQGTSDTFVTKLNATGSGLVYSTFMSQGAGADIALDAGNNAWLVGGVSSERAQNPDNVHTTPDGFQTQFGGGGSDAHVAQLDASGSDLIYGTYLGGTNSDGAGGVALDGAGGVYVMGGTLSADFPTTQGAFDRTFAGDPSIFWGDAFVTKFGTGTTEPPPPDSDPAALSSLSLDPTTVTGGESSTGTVTLDSAAPEGGASITLSSSNTNAATVPASVNVPAGSTSATFTVSTNSVNSDTSSTISASYNGVARTADLTVKAPAPSSTTTEFSGRIDKNQTLRHTVSVGAQGPVDLTLNWNESRVNLTLRVLDPSGNVVFSAGGNARPKTGTFSAAAAGDYRFEITNNTDRRTNYTLSVTHPVESSSPEEPTPDPDPESPTLSSLGLSPISVTGGESSTGTVTLDSAAPEGGVSVDLDSSNTNAATVPASVNVPAGSTSATFTVSTNSVNSDTSSTISASYNGVTRTASLAVNAPAPDPDPAALSSLSLDPTTVTGGESSTGTVTLDSAAPEGGASITLSSNNTDAATVPPSVTVPAGQTSATFTVSTSSVSSDSSATISASYGGLSRTANLTVNAAPADPVTLSSLDLDPTTVTGGESSRGTVTLDSAAPEGGATVDLDSSNTDTATVPASVTVPAGQTSATFTVSTNNVGSDSSSAISASYNGVTRTVILTVNASAPSSTTTNFSGEIDKNQTLRHTVSVGAAGPVDLNLNWNESRVRLTLRVLDPSGNVVFSDSSTDRPKTGTFSAAAAGNYRFEIINSTDRRADYTLAVTHP